MQLNIYVPKSKAKVLRALEDAAKRTGRQKNELVLEALEAYLNTDRPGLQTFNLGEFTFPSREELYSEREDLIFPTPADDSSGR